MDNPIIFIAELIGTIAFASSGAMMGIKKNLDMIVANDVSRDDSGFDVDTNAVTVYYDEKEISFPLMSKQAVAGEIIRLIGKLLK